MSDDTHEFWVTSNTGIFVILSVFVMLPPILIGAYGVAVFLAAFWTIIAVAMLLKD
jgi:hypothetical protein